MGVEARVVLYAGSEAVAIEAAERAFARVGRLQQSFSDWTNASEVARLGARAGAEAMSVSPELQDVLERAIEVARRSGGAFDPTVGPLVRLWRDARARGAWPDPAALEHARGLVDWRALVVDRARGTARLEREGMQIDLGGIGKGFACDAALAEIDATGIQSALFELGGDAACSARPPGSAGWSFDLRAAPGEPPRGRLYLEHRAVSVSGDREQFTVIEGRRLSHVVDPRSGLPLENEARVIVVARDGATSDALATAASVLGMERGLALVRAFGQVEARLEETVGGVRRAGCTPGWTGILHPE